MGVSRLAAQYVQMQQEQQELGNIVAGPSTIQAKPQNAPNAAALNVRVNYRTDPTQSAAILDNMWQQQRAVASKKSRVNWTYGKILKKSSNFKLKGFQVFYLRMKTLGQK